MQKCPQLEEGDPNLPQMEESPPPPPPPCNAHECPHPQMEASAPLK